MTVLKTMFIFACVCANSFGAVIFSDPGTFMTWAGVPGYPGGGGKSDLKSFIPINGLKVSSSSFVSNNHNSLSIYSVTSSNTSCIIDVTIRNFRNITEPAFTRTYGELKFLVSEDMSGIFSGVVKSDGWAEMQHSHMWLFDETSKQYLYDFSTHVPFAEDNIIDFGYNKVKFIRGHSYQWYYNIVEGADTLNLGAETTGRLYLAIPEPSVFVLFVALLCCAGKRLR